MASNEFASIVQGWESVPAALWERLITGFEEPASLAKWLSSPLHWISDHFELAGLGVLIATGGELEICARDGDLPKLLPAEFFMSVLDSSKIEIQSPWIASPLPANFEPNSLLVGWMGSMSNEQSKNHSKWSAGRVSEFRTHSQALGDALAIWKLCKHQRDAIAQRDKIIEVATSWHHHRALPDLLQKMAEAAASLLDSDRASIFLWDKPARQLVGYPALGVEGNPLRIPDDSGIAGRVLKSIQSERWDRSDRTDKVDRTVDEKTGYRTDSIVAVPLVDENAKAIGVFEVLNQRSGRFTVAHEHLLADFARHASTALANLQHIQKLIATRDRLTKNLASQSPLLGNAPAMMKLKETISRVADTDLAVLILGENGSGKEVVSRQIHYLSRRRHEIFVAVNCAAITESLLESELFGHEKGAFTDAIETRLGKFETASGGTLLLDEIGDMSLKGQAKLLRVLEEKVVVRVGGSVPIPVDVRILAATNQDLVELVRQKRFREDLYFRLTVVSLTVPPLRSRGSDILELAESFLQTFCRNIGRSVPTWSDQAKQRLMQYSWPGNVRELRNLVERIAYLTPGDLIDVHDLDFVQSPRAQTSHQQELDFSGTLSQATDEFQRRYILNHIAKSNRNMTAAATSLGMQRTNLYRKMRQLGMEIPERS